MAAVSGPQSVSALTPPHGLHAGGEQEWKHTVSLDPEGTNTHRFPRSHANLQIPSQSKQPDHPNIPPEVSRTSLARNTSPSEHSQRHTDNPESREKLRSGPVADRGYLAPSRVDALGRKESSISQTGSEADSLLDLYRQQSANGSGGNSMDHEDGRRPGPNGNDPYFDDEDPERSKWIHRDKLAKIESQELRQAGYQLPPQFRAASRANDSRGRGVGEQEHITNGNHTDQYQQEPFEKRQRVGSPAPEYDEYYNQDPPSFDLRTPEEIAADRYEEDHSPQMYHHPRVRASSSRIPLPKSSPSPIPQDYIERNTPLPRKRGHSRGWSGGDEDGLSYSKTRNRSHSVGSQILLDDTEHLNGTPTPASRPVSRSINQPAIGKSKVPGKSAPVSGARKIPSANRTASAQQTSRTASSGNRNFPGQRPHTRSGESRPTSAINRPEGDPPWLATMYKPDPRLPPDQQILPTHAKRLQQEQWEKEGKYGSTFDKEFTPITIHTQNGLQRPLPSAADTRSTPKEEEPSAWPLNMTPISPTLSNSRPGTGGTEHGGYSTIPKVQSNPPSGSAHSPNKGPQPTRMQDLSKEEGGKKGGCGCCVVM